MVYVTHDQTEALTFADQVVVMYEGAVVQIGTPQELFERPAHTFVGYFIGSPGHELAALPARRRGGRGSTASACRCTRRWPSAHAAAGAARARHPARVRPPARRAQPGAAGAMVDAVEDLGRYKHRHGALAGHDVKAEAARGRRRSPAETPRLLLPRRAPGSTPTAGDGSAEGQAMSKTVNNKRLAAGPAGVRAGRLQRRSSR